MSDIFDPASEAGWTDLGNGVRRRVRSHRAELMIVEFEFAAGAIGAQHSHPHVQASFIARGTFDVTIAGETRRLGEGATFIVPPDGVHGVVALEDGLLVDSFAPRRDDFLRDR
jgi:quercetin dioxygenase-like cupin family protein